MDALLKKLNAKPGMSVRLVGLPPELSALKDACAENGAEAPVGSPADFAIVFVTSPQEIAYLADLVSALTEGDSVLWACYPKKGASRYDGSINRDTGWEPLGQAGFEPVRQVAIDESWSALRFRRVEFIKTMTRSFAMTEEGKAKSNR